MDQGLGPFLDFQIIILHLFNMSSRKDIVIGSIKFIINFWASKYLSLDGKINPWASEYLSLDGKGA